MQVGRVAGLCCTVERACETGQVYGRERKAGHPDFEAVALRFRAWRAGSCGRVDPGSGCVEGRDLAKIRDLAAVKGDLAVVACRRGD